MPDGVLLDLSANYNGANALVLKDGVKSVFYIGKSYSGYDIGVSVSSGSNWTKISNT